MKTLLILFIISLSNLISDELDSVAVEPKPKYIGFTLGVGAPELLFIGATARLYKDIYFNYKIGGVPKGRTLKNINLLEFDNIRHTLEFVKYLEIGEGSPYFESGTANISLSIFLAKDGSNDDANQKLNFVRFVSLRIGKDYYFHKNIALQFAIGIGSGGYDDENNNISILPTGKLNLLFWF
jgi:hypothetical protein